MGSSNLTRNA